MSNLRLMSVVGARPQFVKLAAVARAIEHYSRARSAGIEDMIVHTGQHYDPGMSAVFFTDLGIPEPAVNLAIGSGGHGEQTGQMLKRIEALLLEREPDLVVTYGDTNSTLAGSLAAAKVGIPVARVEAGLRSFNRRMPEEINRIVSDHVADLLFAPTKTAMRNLAVENLEDRAVLVGDVMYDTTLFYGALARARSDILAQLGLEPGTYGVVTLHRAENTEVERLGHLLRALNRLADQALPLIFPMHPRTRNLIKCELGSWVASARLRIIEPLGYLAMLRLLGEARVAVTDSGGLQKEALFLNCPCVTLREETEWLETVEAGANTLVGSDAVKLVAAVESCCASDRPDFGTLADELYGGGRAAQRIVEEVDRFMARQRVAA